MMLKQEEGSIFVRKNKILSLLLIAPFLIHIAVFTIYPLFNTIILSFKENYSILSDSYSNLGFENYIDIFADKYFLQSIGNTILYAVIVVPITTILSIILAMALNKKLPLYSVFQTIYFLPMVTAATAVSYSWRLIFNSQYGIINSIIVSLGGTPIQWLTSSQYSIVVLSICGIWNMLPFSTLTILSTLQGINKNLYTAASVDGANSILIFRKITFPAIAPSVFLLAILNTISAFRVFDTLFPLFSGRPGPSYNMYTLVYYIYDQMQSFSKGAYGRAAAAAIVLFILLLSLSLIVILVRKSIASSKGIR